MANQEHLTLLLKGSVIWNEWRRAHPDQIPDLMGADLTDMDLEGMDLRRAVLTKANLFRANLSLAR